MIRSKDRAGFIVNALLIPYLLSAIRMMESGFASPTTSTPGWWRAATTRWGRCASTDLIGLDTTLAVAESLYEEFKEPLYAPPPLLSRMVDAGLLGRKTGRGFSEYTRSSSAVSGAPRGQVPGTPVTTAELVLVRWCLAPGSGRGVRHPVL